MKKNKLNSDIFITPLTNRGYLLKIAFDRVCDIYFSSSSSYYLSKKDFSTTYSFNDFRLDYVHIMSIMYLYGSSFSNIHFPYDKKRKSSEIGNTSYALEPSFYFTKTDKPFTKKSNEIAIIKENLEKLGYTLWYPYSWTTEDGEKVRSVINPILDKQNQTQATKKWVHDYDNLCSLIDTWHTDFLKQQKEKYDFSFKLYEHEGHTRFTILDEKINKLTDLEEIKARQEEHMRVVRLFSMYLYREFLGESKLFPKCLYE